MYAGLRYDDLSVGVDEGKGVVVVGGVEIVEEGKIKWAVSGYIL